MDNQELILEAIEQRYSDYVSAQDIAQWLNDEYPEQVHINPEWVSLHAKALVEEGVISRDDQWNYSAPQSEVQTTHRIFGECCHCGSHGPVLVEYEVIGGEALERAELCKSCQDK